MPISPATILRAEYCAGSFKMPFYLILRTTPPEPISAPSLGTIHKFMDRCRAGTRRRGLSQICPDVSEPVFPSEQRREVMCPPPPLASLREGLPERWNCFRALHRTPGAKGAW